jgi:hypothetical protein
VKSHFSLKLYVWCWSHPQFLLFELTYAGSNGETHRPETPSFTPHLQVDSLAAAFSDDVCTKPAPEVGNLRRSSWKYHGGFSGEFIDIGRFYSGFVKTSLNQYWMIVYQINDSRKFYGFFFPVPVQLRVCTYSAASSGCATDVISRPLKGEQNVGTWAPAQWRCLELHGWTPGIHRDQGSSQRPALCLKWW